MAEYRIETHLHTKHTSECAWLDAKTLAEGYERAGYAAIAVTDHYSRITFGYLGIDTMRPGDKITPFLSGYYRMREEGEKRGLKIYRGAELCLDESSNDYLLFDYPEDLLAEPEEIFRMGIAAFAPLARKAGAILVQAHPYRGNCVPAGAGYLDGVEIVNGSPRYENHNAQAEQYARRFGLIPTGGSDCHRAEDIGRSGIAAPVLPKDDAEFAWLLREGMYSVIAARAGAEAAGPWRRQDRGNRQCL